MDIAKLDRFMQARPAQEEGRAVACAHLNRPSCWRDLPFSSRTAHTAAARWIPTRYFPAPGRAALTELGTNTAGGCIRFRSSTGRVLVRALSCGCLRPCTTCPPPDQGGFDCYLRRPGGAWRYAGPSVFGHGETAYTAALVERRGPGGKGISNSFSAVHGRERGMGGR